ncbi:hypothetical protein NBRC116494_07740 [Aurantivibrio plasticivorans]
MFETITMWRYVHMVKMVFCVTLLNVLGGCVAREQVEQMPHVNLSPDNVSLASLSTTSIDIGLSVSANESDSLMDMAILPGLRVRRVDAGSVADVAGLRSGDVILSVNGIDTNKPDTLYAILEPSENEGDVAQDKKFNVIVRRDTTLLEVGLLVSPKLTGSSVREVGRIDPLKTRAAYRLVNYHENQVALQVLHLFGDSPLQQVGIDEGDIILEMNGQPIVSAQSFVNDLLANSDYGESIRLRIHSLGQIVGEVQIKELSVTLWKPERKVTSVNLWPLFTYSASADGEMMRWSLLDFWLLWLFAYEQENNEKSVNILRLMEFSTGYGELTQE